MAPELASDVVVGVVLGSVDLPLHWKVKRNEVSMRIGELAERAGTLDPEQCPPERICHIIT
jgi:hypothetical protein